MNFNLPWCLKDNRYAYECMHIQGNQCKHSIVILNCHNPTYLPGALRTIDTPMGS